MQLVLALVTSLCLLTSTPAGAARLVSGDVTAQNVAQLTSEIQWQQSLPQAQYQAQRQGKMIFWVHMLGNLSGAT
jgi:hypothetical protein